MITSQISAIALANDWRRETLRVWAGSDRTRQHIVAGIGRIVHTRDGAGYLAIHWVQNGTGCSYGKARDEILSLATLPGLARVTADEVVNPPHRGARYVAGLAEYRSAASALAAEQGWRLPPPRSGPGTPVDLPRGAQGSIRCPFHGDDSPSLWVHTLASGLVVGRCYGACCGAAGPIVGGRMWNLNATPATSPRSSSWDSDTISSPPVAAGVATAARPAGQMRTVQMRIVPDGVGGSWARFSTVSYEGSISEADRSRRVRSRRRPRAMELAEAGEQTYESVGLRAAGPGDWRQSEDGRWWPARFSVLGSTERVVIDVDGMVEPLEGAAAERAVELCSWWPDFPIRGLRGASVMSTSHSGMQLHLWLAEPMSAEDQATFFADPEIREALIETGELLIEAVDLGGWVDPSTLHPGAFCRSPGPRKTSRGPHAGEMYNAHWVGFTEEKMAKKPSSPWKQQQSKKMRAPSTSSRATASAPAASPYRLAERLASETGWRIWVASDGTRVRLYANDPGPEVWVELPFAGQDPIFSPSMSRDQVQLVKQSIDVPRWTKEILSVSSEDARAARDGIAAALGWAAWDRPGYAGFRAYPPDGARGSDRWVEFSPGHGAPRFGRGATPDDVRRACETLCRLRSDDAQRSRGAAAPTELG
jgi:hypothetical protein